MRLRPGVLKGRDRVWESLTLISSVQNLSHGFLIASHSVLLPPLHIFFHSPNLYPTQSACFASVERCINLAVHHPSHQRTLLVSVNLTLDLSGESLWVDCESKYYVTSTFRPARCRSAQCDLAGSTACATATNTCGLFPENTVTRTSTYDDLMSSPSNPPTGRTPDKLFLNVTFCLFIPHHSS
ncbi:hypothetical protein RJ639_035338 [Escallonia herrerae]|uniref:Xylanase inhibitor N-terminal domain-containing protein n=1 Tax=Escallonia herrerae TaxID=1293975 RepID=A0AA88WNS8_9ASTE|nr:hypothetical protein RJ639_035338 [Escallonia herrerae]